MESYHSAEIRLLLAACTLSISPQRQAQINQILEQKNLDWERLRVLVERHRLAPFLYRILRQVPNTPPSFLGQLQIDCRTATTDSLLKRHQYELISALLAEKDIDHLPLKGIRLWLRGYPDSSLRISGDIDLLVDPQDVVETIALLHAQGYQLTEQHRQHWQYAQQTIFSDLYEVSLLKPFANGSQFDIDLHWRVLGFNSQYVALDLAYLRADPEHLLEREVVVLIMHHGVTNIWQHIYYINDLYFLLHQQPIDWTWLMLELQRFGFERVFLVGLYWCYHIWQAELPPFIQAFIESTAIAVLADAYAKNWETERPYAFSALIVRQAVFLFKAQTLSSQRVKLCRTFLSSRVFRYSAFKVGQRFVYVPRQAGALTVLVRAVQSLVRFFPARTK